MANSSDDPIKTGLHPDIWALRDLGSSISNLDPTRPYSREDILYLINRFPFLKILDAHKDLSGIEELPNPSFVRAESGWLMHDYGFYICSSLGELLYGSYNAVHENKEEEDEGEGIIELNPGKGTVIKQSFDTAAEMIALARNHGWKAIYILEGTDLMNWAAWVISEELGLEVEGFQPTEKDQEKRDRLKRGKQLEEMNVRLKIY